ncbi:MAG: DUF4038 domain-containing protein [Planctomycetales bacterium]|nr:DUF4038 domain-containing protein [Planctomycetales bacterium]
MICPVIHAANFTSGRQAATRFGVHEIVLTGQASIAGAPCEARWTSDGDAGNPFDTIVTVKFTPPSGDKKALSVQAFYDGDNTWRARVYVSEAGAWKWSSSCDKDPRLNGQTGSFAAIESKLRGRLLPHPKNARHWITENGRWFLNLNDTAYFLLCAHDGNGDPISDEQATRYVRDDVARGITSVRCFLASRREGFVQSREQWIAWHFETDSLDRLRLEAWQCADLRLRMLLDQFPDVAVQLILFPLEGYGRDDRFWSALSAVRRDRLLRNLVARFAAYPQIFWLMTNDAHYGDKHPNNNAMVREIGAYLKQHDPWQHPRSTGHARRLPFIFGAEDWVDYIHIEHEHDLGALEYAKYHGLAKPVFLGEDRYEQDPSPRPDPMHMQYWQRRLFWAWLLSGGSANYGGRWWCVHPYGDSESLAATFRQSPGVTFRAALTGLDSVRPIRDYFEQRDIDLGEFEPDHVLAEDADGRTGAQAPRLLRRRREEFLLYHPHAAADGQDAHVTANTSARLRVNLQDAPGTFSVEWYQTEDGQTRKGDNLTGGDWLDLSAPWPGQDVVIRLRKE